jgi:invasion protein IalB
MRGSPHLFLAATPLWSRKQARVDPGMTAASASPAGHAAWHLRASRPKKTSCALQEAVNWHDSRSARQSVVSEEDQTLQQTRLARIVDHTD